MTEAVFEAVPLGLDRPGGENGAEPFAHRGTVIGVQEFDGIAA